MPNSLGTSKALFEAIQVADLANGVGAFNWVLYELGSHPVKFDDVAEFVDLWLMGVDMPDVQMAWVLATSFDAGWEKVILARVGHDEQNRSRLLDILQRAAQADPDAPPYLGAGGGGSARAPRDLVDTSDVSSSGPAHPAPAAGAPSQSTWEPTASDSSTFGGGDSLASRVRDSAGGLFDKVVRAVKPSRFRDRRRMRSASPESVGSDDVDPAPPSDTLPARQFQVSQLKDDPREVELEYSDRVKEMVVETFGDLSFDSELIPDDGLVTHWQVTSDQRITAVSTTIDISTLERGGVTTRWFADFELVLPKETNSDIVTIRCDGEASQRLDIRIYSTGLSSDLLRHITANVSTTDYEPESALETQEISEIADSIDPPMHSFTTPPDHLTLSVYGTDALKVRPSKEGSHTGGAQPWPAATLVAPNVERLRLSAERLRQRHSGAFETIEAGELTARLKKDLESGFLARTATWGEQDYADVDVMTEHQDAWDAIANSDEALDLAHNGFALYDTLFPDGTPARLVLDDLVPGSRVSVDWLLGAGNAAMPWNLMYTRPPPRVGPVDAETFLGMRFRWSWSKWNVAPSQMLGATDTVERVHLLYWHDDDIGIEANHQRSVLAGLSNHRAVPTSGDTGADSRQQAIGELAKPTDAAILHFYCHCAEDNATKQTKLIFGPMQREADYRVMGRDFGSADLQGAPLVFVNACESAAGDSYHVNQLEQMFFQRGCRAFMGTEIRVPVALASRYSQVFFALLEARPDGTQIFTGEAAALARRYLWLNYRNIGGLFYSYIHHYGLRMMNAPPENE